MRRWNVSRAAFLAAWIGALGRAGFALTSPTPVQISPAPADASKPLCHDFPDVAVTSPGARAIAVWSAYDFYTADAEELYTAVLSGTTWQTAAATGVTGDLWCPRVGDAGAGDEWILWAQQVSGSWDISARHFASGTITRLTTDAGSDTNLATVSDPARGRIIAVWQGNRGGRWAILLREYSSGTWGPEQVVSQPSANEWFPKAAVDSTGRVWIAWDSYRNGNYDIYLRSYSPDIDTFGAEIQVTANPKYEANVSVTCDVNDRVWLAWEIGRENWGKDDGRLVDEARLNPPRGYRFMIDRAIAVGVYDGTVKTTSAPISALYPNGTDTYAFLGYTFDPTIAVDSHDRPWVFHARRFPFSATDAWSGWRLAMTLSKLWRTAAKVWN
ncbi:MAG: hypothetical protein NTW86_10880, partial [Candidatus Sumerlaeota bacterium]|nr:hypothetical protein [Candidatus Sumerlaeota bacterium]